MSIPSKMYVEIKVVFHANIYENIKLKLVVEYLLCVYQGEMGRERASTPPSMSSPIQQSDIKFYNRLHEPVQSSYNYEPTVADITQEFKRFPKNSTG